MQKNKHEYLLYIKKKKEARRELKLDEDRKLSK